MPGSPTSDIQILGPNDRKKNLVVRLHGSGKHKPILLIGHLDVVEARREDWTTDPFKFVEKDGRFYGRGTQDMKNGDAIMMATLIRLKKEGFRPSRDIILALTADEESGDSNGSEWLLKNHRDLVDAAVRHQPRRQLHHLGSWQGTVFRDGRHREGVCGLSADAPPIPAGTARCPCRTMPFTTSPRPSIGCPTTSFPLSSTV